MAMRQIHKNFRNLWLSAVLWSLRSVVFAILFAPVPANAQLFFSRVAPADVVSIVRNRGFYDISYPYFRGDVYVLDATERRGLRVRLVIDPKSGEIVERLLVGRNNSIYPSPNNIIERTDVERRNSYRNRNDERPGVERRIIERPVQDNDVQSRSSVEIYDPESRVKRVQPKKRRPQNTEPDAVKPFNNKPEQDQTPEPKSDVLITSPNVGQPAITVSPAVQTPINPSAAPAQAAVQPVITAPSTPERGTRENPRKVGPIVPPPVGIE